MSSSREPTADESRPQPSPPRQLGPYIHVALHAKGGLGEVLKATDADLHRTVAIKRLQDGHTGNSDSQRRFLWEAEITARLEHPGVVPVYALLRDDPSRPCYAMRFVEGQTFAAAISAYHAGQPDALAFRRLLQCFLQICQTVAYAHSRGIIHRDLKPANVMLGRFGETLVVDWGLAKAVGRVDEVRSASAEATLEPSGTPTGEATAFGSAVGTPAFMSPEQAAGRWDIVNTASDIYSLGAVLYTLLTGRSPLAASNWPELLQKIQRGDFPRPRQVQPETPRALEAICLKAMALEPNDRYASVQALAADIERWLADEPGSAWRDPPWVRAWRWMRRHMTLVSVTAALVLASLAAAAAGLVLLDRKNREIAAERNTARSAAEQAQAINEFLIDDLLGQADPDVNYRTNKITVEELLDKAATKIDGNPKFADQSELEATVRLTIGKAYFKLGNFTEAEKHLQRALELRREALGPDDLRTLDAQDELTSFWNLGQTGRAEDLARQTWEARVRLLGSEHRDTLVSLDIYATALFLAGRPAEAMARHAECLAVRRRVLGPTDPDTVSSINNLSIVLVDEGKLAEVVPLLREVFELSGRSQGTTSLTSMYNLANALYLKGDLDEAERLLQDCVKQSGAQYGEAHPMTDRMRGALVAVWLDQGRLQDAVSLAQEVVVGRGRVDMANRAPMAYILVQLGRGLVLQDRHADALLALDAALGIFATAKPSPEYLVAWAECWRGASLAGLHRFEEAQSVLLAAEGKLRTGPGLPPRHYQQAVRQIVTLYDAWGKPQDAAKWRASLTSPPKLKMGSNPQVRPAEH